MRSSWRFTEKYDNNVFKAPKSGTQYNNEKNVIAPYGISKHPIDYTTSNRPNFGKKSQPEMADGEPVNIPAGLPSWPMRDTCDGGNDNKLEEEAFGKLREKLIVRGLAGVLGLIKNYRVVDVDVSGVINLFEFGKGIKENRLNIDEVEMKRIFALFELENSGTMSYYDLFNAIRGRMNDDRADIVSEVFNYLDHDGDGYVAINILREKFNPNYHPDCLERRKSHDQIINDFITTFDTFHALYTND